MENKKNENCLKFSTLVWSKDRFTTKDGVLMIKLTFVYGEEMVTLFSNNAEIISQVDKVTPQQWYNIELSFRVKEGLFKPVLSSVTSIK